MGLETEREEAAGALGVPKRTGRDDADDIRGVWVESKIVLLVEELKLNF